MIRHVVMWVLKKNARGNTKDENAFILKAELENLKNEIPEIIKLEVGINNDEYSSKNFDVVLITEFKSFEDLDKYKHHPKHVEIIDLVKEIVENRACVDYTF
ncbi:stress responsive alpha/beta barrel protein [Hypnocyclicus thermotrophus]|uniref:Stress responsive alpha/beta barrel protein n=1 Tax=Hypnocyclicus thermotrophus TaxID=1627895 RepID=A0AA46E0M3_9FUSO|nr:Dabb family protein [Hypnocyclicus thermotrophus]TDT72590.1 stress responsive alpha/beta barrel protein [Hypnocyclicus thermotrophus]